MKRNTFVYFPFTLQSDTSSVFFYFLHVGLSEAEELVHFVLLYMLPQWNFFSLHVDIYCCPV